MRKSYPTIAFILAALTSAHLASSAPIPRGDVYKIKAKVLSLDRNKTSLATDMSPGPHQNRKVWWIPSVVEILDKAEFVKKGERYFAFGIRNRYEKGDTLEHVLLKFYDEEQLNKIGAGAIVTGTIFSHGDESGDWYVFDI